MPETPYSDDEKDLMLRHERIHVKQKHSWDLMLMNVICAIQFFNPFVWLLKREMRLNHEFLADRGALENSNDSEKYFSLLLQKNIINQLAFTHSFHYSPIKHRIIMQNSKPAKALNQVRYLALIPVALALTFLFACQTDPKLLLEEPSAEANIDLVDEDIISIVEEEALPAQLNKIEEDNPVFTIVETPPQFPGGEEARMNFLRDNIRYPAAARKENIQGTVFASFVIEKDGSLTDVKILRGIGGGCDEEVIRVVKLMPNWIPGEQRGRKVRTQFALPVNFSLSE